MQCSTGPACEREARGVLRRWSGGSLFNCTRGVAKREPPGGRGGGVGFETPRENIALRAWRRGHPDGSRAPSIPVGKFTVNIFPGTLSSF